MAAFIPAPLGFWFGIASAVLGPGWHFPLILFPRKVLSLPEQLLIVVLTSVFIDTSLLASLNAAGVALDRFVVGTVLIGASLISAGAAYLRQRNLPDTSSYNSEQPAWLAFAGGVVLVLLATVVLVNVMGW